MFEPMSNVVVNPDVNINITTDTVTLNFPVNIGNVSTTLSILFTYDQLRSIIDHVYMGGIK